MSTAGVTFGVMLVRDEADVIEGTVRHLVDEVDHVLVADNRSIDGTREILAKLVAEGLPITLVDDLDPAYYQSLKVSALAARAADLGADWILPVDADELHYSRFGRVADVLAGCAADGYTRVGVELWNHYRTAVDVEDDDPFLSMVYRTAEPAALRKVAFRWAPGAVVHQGAHGVDLPVPGEEQCCPLEIRHFAVRDPGQFTRKAINGAEALKLADGLPTDSGLHWKNYGELMEREGVDVMTRVYNEHFYYLSPTDSGLILDPAPYMRWRT
jgi:hypothetical protein